MKDLKQLWTNMRNGIYYVRGIHDSTTTKRVIASRDGNYFGPDVCFIDYKENLPKGTYYIDCEKCPS
jgi:hypothetical protein